MQQSVVNTSFCIEREVEQMCIGNQNKYWIADIPDFTVLQKLSKCEFKAWLCWYLIILPPLRFCVKSNFGEFKQSKNVIFGNFRGSQFWFLVNLSNFQSQIYPNSKFRISKIATNDTFGPFKFTKIRFHGKSEWR